MNIYECECCGNSIPLSTVQHSQIDSGTLAVPKVCFSCLNDQEALAGELDDLRDIMHEL